jgi:6-pyruvoyltetrahydropterin/6-carboxytetrahydropterin synthase
MSARVFELSQKFFFEAAHSLRRDIDAQASRNIHGHTYHAEVVIAGMPGANSGMVIDLGLFRQEIERVRGLLDHRFLDEVEGIGPATLENLCAYLFAQLQPALPTLTQVSVERPASGDRCVLRTREPALQAA